MYYVMRASAPSLHRESTDSLIYRIECSIACDTTTLILFTSPACVQQNTADENEPSLGRRVV